ncbi:interleukin-17D-like [Conger conger]|uniref:interleukin-17D-like n=1 Tax=Conger conger TaxID=82655 RepID=UPI002A5A2B1A|nr:interleukin-17D-like [Conger conger]
MLGYFPLALLALLSGEVVAGPKVVKKPPRARPCLDLPDEILEQMFGRLSVGVLSAFHHTLQLEPTDTRNLTCPSGGRPNQSSESSVAVNLLSISPWAYRITHDAARFPRYIPEAYCLCAGCLTGPLGQESGLYRSTPVYMPTVILRRTGSCAGGRHTYTESYVSIAVGCTCVPLLQHHPTTTQSQGTQGRRPGGVTKHNHSAN